MCSINCLNLLTAAIAIVCLLQVSQVIGQEKDFVLLWNESCIEENPRGKHSKDISPFFSELFYIKMFSQIKLSGLRREENGVEQSTASVQT